MTNALRKNKKVKNFYGGMRNSYLVRHMKWHKFTMCHLDEEQWREWQKWCAAHLTEFKIVLNGVIIKEQSEAMMFYLRWLDNVLYSTLTRPQK